MKSLYVFASVLAIGCNGAVGGSTAMNNRMGHGGDGTGGDGSLPNAGAAGLGYGAGAPGTGGAAGGAAVQPGAEVMNQPTWRLTDIEYQNSVKDLLGIDVTAELAPDSGVAGYAVGKAADDAAVAAYHLAAVSVSANTTALLPLVPCTAAQITADATGCAAKFIDAIGPKAFRRPLDADTRTGLVNLFAAINTKFGFNAGLQGLTEEMLQSPYFLYHLELEEQAKGVGKFPVTGYSMASRLSYLIWASMPDDMLFAKAAANQLSTPDQIAAEATRLLGSPKAKTGLRNFYEQWLKVNTLPVSKGGTFTANYDQAAILGSFDAQVDAALWAPTGGLTALLTGTQAFVNDKTAPLFGVNGITGSAYQPITVKANERAGILMHPAIMATFATETGSHPIKRGVFMWDQVVCQALDDPPPNVPSFPPVPAGSSVRTAYETFTSPVFCQMCHERINPVGFLFENYDTIGRYRTIDDNNQPVVSAATIIKAHTVAGMDDATLNVLTPNAVQFAKNLAADGGVTTQCLVTQLYRYALRRIDNSADVPTIAGLTNTYSTSSQNISALISGIAKTQGFLNRQNVQ